MHHERAYFSESDFINEDDGQSSQLSSSQNDIPPLADYAEM